MLLPAAPRATHGGNSKFTSSGTKFVSHWWRPGLHLPELALALEVLLGGHALGELERVVVDEVRVAEHVEDDGQIGNRREAGGLGSRPVEDLVLRVQRNGEDRARPPLERVLPPVRALDDGRPAPGYDVDQLVVHMPLGLEFAARGDLRDVGREVVALPRDVDVRPEAAHALPRLHRHAMAIHRVALEDGNPLIFEEVAVGKNPVIRVELDVVAHNTSPARVGIGVSVHDQAHMRLAGERFCSWAVWTWGAWAWKAYPA